MTVNDDDRGTPVSVDESDLGWEIVNEGEVLPDEAEEKTIEQSKDDPQRSLEDMIRKTGVAVAGGAMVGVGLVMIPLPTPFGAVIAGSGMAVLGMEFPAAQRVLEKSCNTVADAIEQNVQDNDDATLPCSNEKMKELMQSSNKRTLSKSVKALGKKAVPVIRKIGDGIDKEQLHQSFSKAATDTKETVSKVATDTTQSFQLQASKFWRHMMVLEDHEDLMSPFEGLRPSARSTDQGQIDGFHRCNTI